MTLDVTFSESNHDFPVGFSESNLVVGADGATFVPSVSEDGVLSWKNNKDLPNPEPVNITGPKGDSLGKTTPKGGEIFNFYTDTVYTGDNPPKEYPGNTAAKGAHAQNFGTHADGEYSSASGWNSTASGGISDAGGRETEAGGYCAVSRGWGTKASNSCADAGGKDTEASGLYSFTRGLNTKAPGSCADAGGKGTEASGPNSFTRGLNTKAPGTAAVANGESTEAPGYCADAGGYKTKAKGTTSFTRGRETEAREYASSAFGRGTIATARNQHVQGAWNVPDVPDANGNGKYAHIVGGGKGNSSRKNIYTIDWNGLGWFAEGLKVGGTSQDDKNAASVLTTADMATITASVIAALPRYNGEVIAV
ncbi:MAG: hypothetical protein IJB91_06190 [Oscillospiraceae bacterium]|nr:hypothetical protein [Oscillospiraceae bacterium]